MHNSMQEDKREILHHTAYIPFLGGQCISHMKIYSVYNIFYSLCQQFSFYCVLGFYTSSPTGKYSYTKNIENKSNNYDLCSMSCVVQVGLVSANENKHGNLLSLPATMNSTDISSMLQDNYVKQLCELVCGIIPVPCRFIRSQILDQCARIWLNLVFSVETQLDLLYRVETWDDLISNWRTLRFLVCTIQISLFSTLNWKSCYMIVQCMETNTRLNGYQTAILLLQ